MLVNYTSELKKDEIINILVERFLILSDKCIDLHLCECQHDKIEFAANEFRKLILELKIKPKKI